MIKSVYRSLATTTVSSPVSSVTFSNILQLYNVLVISWSGSSSTTESLNVRFNSDFGNNYSRVSWSGTHPNLATASSSFNSGFASLGEISTSHSFGFVKIFNCSETEKQKHHSSIFRFNQTMGHHSGSYNSSLGISSITLSLNSGLFQTGSSISLHGII